jgi:hypothetical protein
VVHRGKGKAIEEKGGIRPENTFCDRIAWIRPPKTRNPNLIATAALLLELSPAGVAATEPTPTDLAEPALKVSLVSSTRHFHPDCANGAPVVSRSCTVTVTRSPTATVLVPLALALAADPPLPASPSCAHSGRVSVAEKHAMNVR